MTTDYLTLLLEQADDDFKAHVREASARMFERETIRRPMFAGLEPGRPGTAAAAAAFPQVTELLQPTGGTKDFRLQQLSDLQESAGRRPHSRHVLEDRAEARRKYEIETGIYRDGTIRQPLESWSAPGSNMRSMALYFQITSAALGAVTLGQLTAEQLGAVTWMRDQQLVSVGDRGEVLPLSDGRPPLARQYPGAPINDAAVRRRYSAYLRDRARGLVLAAVANLSAGRSVRRSKAVRRRETLVADGLAITAADVCAEANRIKSARADLEEFRYLSLSTCRVIIRDLIGTGLLEEIVPPLAVRRYRSWRTLPRVIRKLTAAALERLGLLGLTGPEAGEP